MFPEYGRQKKRLEKLIEKKQKEVNLLESYNKGDITDANVGHLYEIELKPDPEDFLDYHKPLKDQPKAMERIDAAKKRLQDLKNEKKKIMDDHVADVRSGNFESTLPDELKWAEEMFVGKSKMNRTQEIEDEIAELNSMLKIVDHPGHSFQSIESPMDKQGYKTPKWFPGAEVSEAFRNLGFPGHRFLDGMSRSGKRPNKDYNYVVYPTDDQSMINITNPPGSLLD